MSTPNAIQNHITTALGWLRRFNTLSIRERAFVSAAALGATWAVWFYFVDEHFSMARAQAQRSVDMVRAESDVTRQKKQELQLLAAQDPDEPVARELAHVKNELANMEANLQSSLSQFVSPNAMTLVLRDVMSDHKNLTLTLLNRLPARELLQTEDTENLYLHPMRLELEGEYLDVLNYVTSLEHGDWQFNWRSFDYTTKEYPNGVATIEIETLSRDEHWLGL